MIHHLKQYRATYYTNAFNIVNIIALCGVVLGICYSRAIVTMAMLLCTANVVWALPLRVTVNKWLQDAFSVCGIVYFLFYLISGLWSDDKHIWAKVVFGNIPFLFYPFAFANMKALTNKQFWMLLLGVNIILLTVTLKSSYLYFTFKQEMINGYNYSQVIPTNFNNDHIRFSLLAVMNVITIILGLDKVPIPNFKGKKLAYLLWIILAALYVFILHLLSVKTGLLCFYVFILLFSLVKIKGNRNKILIIAGLGMAIFALYKMVPTFQLKLNYLQSELSDFQQTSKLDYHYSDAGRIISYKVAKPILKANWLIGVGAGDVEQQMALSYRNQFPQVPAENRLLPHNQFIVTFLSIGIPMGCILLAFFVVIVKSALSKRQFYEFATVLIFFICMMVEPWLTTQFGIATFLYYLLLIKWLDKNTDQNNS